MTTKLTLPTRWAHGILATHVTSDERIQRTLSKQFDFRICPMHDAITDKSSFEMWLLY